MTEKRIRKRRCPICLKPGRFFAGRCPNCGHLLVENPLGDEWRGVGRSPKPKPRQVPHRPGR